MYTPTPGARKEERQPLPRSLESEIAMPSLNRRLSALDMSQKRRRAVGDPFTVLCFGDSNTHGQSSEALVRHPLADRWTTHLQQLLGSDYHVIPEGLNGRTTVIDDPTDCDFAGVGGGNLNGRRYLMPCLHSHKPIAAVVLALGCNDMKARFNMSAADIRRHLKLLIADVCRCEAGEDGAAPHIVVVSPPLCQETDTALDWGFEGAAAKSRATIAGFEAECAEKDIPFVDLSAVAQVGTDGIHFPAAAAAPIAAAVAAALRPLFPPPIGRNGIRPIGLV